jgi:hypothetical protein
MYNVDGELIASLPLVEGKIKADPGLGGYYNVDLTMKKEDIYRLGLSIMIMSKRDMMQNKELLKLMIKKYDEDVFGYEKVIERLREQIVNCNKVNDKSDEEDDEDGWEYDWM